jgi:hypothetical protein
MHRIRAVARDYWWIGPLIVVAGSILWAMNIYFPKIGDDFRYFLGELFAGNWHFYRQGLLPPRFIPQLCGGFPQYGNPHDMYYSLTQLLFLLLPAWSAIQISVITMLCIGYAGWYLVGRDVMDLEKHWSHAFALIVIANGFHLAHMAAGHLNYQMIPVIGWFVWLLLDRRRNDDLWILVIRTIAFGLLALTFIHAGEYPALAFTAVLMAFAIPLDMLMSASFGNIHRARTLVCRTVFAGAAALILCMSKIIAVWSFMRYFPRSVPFDKFITFGSSVTHALRAFFKFPQWPGLFVNFPLGTHEHTMFVSPAVLPSIAMGLVLVFLSKKPWLSRWKQGALAIVFIIFTTVFFLQISSGHGFFSQWLNALPVFSSLHAMTRFLYIPAIFLAAVAMWSLQLFCRRFMPDHKKHIAVAVCIVTAVALPFAEKPIFRGIAIGHPYDVLLQEKAASPFPRNTFTHVVRSIDSWQTVLRGSTAIYCYEPLLSSANWPQAKELRVGPVRQIFGGAWNIVNPSCYQYPKENDCKPGDRIRLSDSENFERFIRGLPTSWKLSTMQHAADAITLISLAASLFTLTALAFRSFVQDSRRRTRKATAS